MFDLAESAKTYFAPVQAETEPVSIWRYNARDTGAKLLPYGAIIPRQNVFCTDVNTSDFFRNLLLCPMQAARYAPTVITPRVFA